MRPSLLEARERLGSCGRNGATCKLLQCIDGRGSCRCIPCFKTPVRHVLWQPLRVNSRSPTCGLREPRELTLRCILPYMYWLVQVLPRPGLEGSSSPWPARMSFHCTRIGRSVEVYYARLKVPTSPWLQQPLTEEGCIDMLQVCAWTEPAPAASVALRWIETWCYQYLLWLRPTWSASMAENVPAAGFQGLSSRHLLPSLTSGPRHTANCEGLLPKVPFSPGCFCRHTARAMGHSAASKRRQRQRPGKRQHEQLAQGNGQSAASDIPVGSAAGTAAASESVGPEATSAVDVGSANVSPSRSTSPLGLPLQHMPTRAHESPVLDEEAETLRQTVGASSDGDAHMQTMTVSTASTSSALPSSGSAALPTDDAGPRDEDVVIAVTSSSDELQTPEDRQRKCRRPPTPPRPGPHCSDDELVMEDYTGYPTQSPNEPRLAYLRRCRREALLESKHPSTDWAKSLYGKTPLPAQLLHCIRLALLITLRHMCAE